MPVPSLFLLQKQNTKNTLSYILQILYCLFQHWEVVCLSYIRTYYNLIIMAYPLVYAINLNDLDRNKQQQQSYFSRNASSHLYIHMYVYTNIRVGALRMTNAWLDHVWLYFFFSVAS